MGVFKVVLMSFLSLEFIFSFATFMCLYWCFAKSPVVQNVLLLIASYAFVATFSFYALGVLFVYSTLIVILGVLAHKISARKMVGLLLLFLICLMFILFKYYDAIFDTAQTMFENIGLSISLPILNLVLPLGLSFYLFHSVSYILDIKNEKIVPAPIWLVYLYLAFFPSVVSGPINRATDTKYQTGLLTQLQETLPRTVINPKYAIILICMATLKLWVLSSYLDDWYVKEVFNSPASATSDQVVLGIYAYAFQIYFNFSGYSELVLALGMLLGLHLPTNFNTPYVAKNLKEFWDRWHISLSLFIRDFIYIPLGGGRNGFLSTQRNVLIAMVLSGIWHGVGINFILWGALHGLGQVISNIYGFLKQKLIGSTVDKAIEQPNNNALVNNILQFVYNNAMRLLTFHFICFTWIFFRSSNWDDTVTLLDVLSNFNLYYAYQLNVQSFSVFFVAILFYPIITKSCQYLVINLSKVNWFLFIILMIIIFQLVVYLAPSGVPGFIYATF